MTLCPNNSITRILRGARSFSTLAVFLLLIGCGRPAGKKAELRHLNVILVTVDTLRADFVSAYEDGRANTPNLDRLAGEGMLFERCIAQTPLTLPSHTTILSGTYPLYHQVRDNGALVPDRLKLLSEVLKSSGLETSAFIAAYVLHSKWGLHRGFDVYSDVFDRTRYERLLLQNDKRAEEVLEEAKSWLERKKDARFFSWIHLFDPHAPYMPPEPFDKYPSEPYRGEVEYTDSALGEFFQFLRESGIYDKSLIIVASDHGEGLGQHQEHDHGFFVYDTTVRVPLIMRAPVDFPVKKVDAVVELVDIAPTILEALDIPVPDSFQGQSLLDLMFDEGGGRDSFAYTETFYPRAHYGWSELRALYHRDEKYILAPEDELYALNDDEEENNNLASEPSHEGRREELAQNLRDLVDRHSANSLPAAPASLSRDDMEALRALGYATTVSSTTDQTNLADPKKKIGVYNRLTQASGRLGRQEYDAAIEVANEILREEPDLLEAHVLLGNAYQQKGMFRQALTSLYRVIELNPQANFTMIDIVSALLNLGEHDRAVREAQTFLTTFPEDPVLHEELGFAYFYKGDLAKALEALESSIRIEPNPVALSKAGEIYAMQRDYPTAESYLHRSLAMNPRSKNTHYVLGYIEETKGNPDQAMENYKKEFENNPQEFRAAYNIATIMRKQGHYDSAIPFYRKTMEANPGFNMSYFMIANYFLERDTHLDEAIELCKRGIEAKPQDESALLGYEILTRVYAKRGDRANYELYSRIAKELLASHRKGK